MTSIELQTIVGQLKPNAIYHVELNRPQALNAMSKQFFQDIQTIFIKIEQLKLDHDIRVVVLTARGKHFSAGLDLKEAPENFSFPEEMDNARKSVTIYNLIKDWQKSMKTLQDCTVPVIVGCHGYCIGGAIDLITSADIRYCTEDTKFTIKEVDIGMAADIGTLQRIDELNSNNSLTRELVYTARFFGPTEAKEIGLVSKVVKDYAALEKEIWNTAETISSKSPVAIYTSKAVLVRQMRRKTEENLDFMARINSAMLFSTDVEEAIKGSLLKQKPVYPKL